MLPTWRNSSRTIIMPTHITLSGGGSPKTYGGYGGGHGGRRGRLVTKNGLEGITPIGFDLFVCRSRSMDDFACLLCFSFLLLCLFHNFRGGGRPPPGIFLL